MYSISSPNRDQLHSTDACKRNRNRGVLLSEQGWQKLVQANVLHDKWGNRYTYEMLSERSLLNERTVSRILSCEVRVDRRSLKIFFAAFDLHLADDDYTTAERYPAERSVTSLLPYRSPTAHTIEANLSYQELRELHQRLVEDLSYLSHLLNLLPSQDKIWDFAPSKAAQNPKSYPLSFSGKGVDEMNGNSQLQTRELN